MKEGGPTFQTDRLKVCGWHEASRSLGVGSVLPDIVRSFLTPGVTSQLPPDWQGEFSDGRAREWIRDRDAEGMTLLATSRETGQPVGLVLLHEASTGEERPELRLGYLIDESQWGRGYATELVNGVVAWAREESFGSIVAGVSAHNVPSQRVLEKSDFVRVSGASGSHTECFYSISL